jgi:hypothetical protein
LLYVTIHNYKIGSGSPVDVAVAAEEFLGLVGRIPGFRAYYLIDGGDGLIGSVSIFETRDGVEECDRRATEFVEGHPEAFACPKQRSRRVRYWQAKSARSHARKKRSPTPQPRADPSNWRALARFLPTVRAVQT